MASEQLPLMEHFRSIQGEGYHTGLTSYFLRIGGCDVGCHWCDVKESWDASKHPMTDVQTVIELPAEHDQVAVITGGEPMMWDMGNLTNGLNNRSIRTHLETSGAYPHSGTWDWVCLSPKKTMPAIPVWHTLADELKVIIHNAHDLQWAQAHADKVNEDCVLYLQPEWSKRETILPSIIAHLEAHPEWKLSLQTHKYLGMP